MIRSIFLNRLTPHILSCSRASRLLTGRIPNGLQPHPSAYTQIHQSSHESVIPKIKCSDLSKNNYTRIYAMPYISIFRAISRIKLLQTAITVVVLPPVYVLYFLGHTDFFQVSYTTGVALFAGVMLFVASHFFRRIVGIMYLDQSQTTLKISHLTFWGKRHNIYLPVSDVMTIWDSGDSPNETILKMKRYSTPDVMYFSTYFGVIVDRQGFEKVFGKIS
ncbi:transmembrane protein 186 [Nematolebias whitei]|uniref:transmembrane protein 186 n=1 Tax=Nematolebias whitei TaxID=451745 RepID=UPI001896C493|nr:transmembrane protein 186 [Nematolebias whitei]